MARSKGEGTYQKLPSGKIRFVMTVDGRRVPGPAAQSRKEARVLWDDEDRSRRKRLQEESEAEERKSTFAWFFHHQLEGRLKAHMAPATYALYQTVYDNQVREHAIGDTRLKDVTPQQVEAWKSELSIRLGPRSVARYLQCLKALFEHAKAMRLVDHNPAEGVRPPRCEEAQKRVLTAEQVQRLLGLDMPPRVRLGVLLCLHGLRRSEACGLRHEDFDGEGVTIVRQAQEVNGKLFVRELKTAASSRWVPVDQEISKKLSLTKTGYVLDNRLGGPMRPRNLARDFDKTIVGTEFEGVDLHDLRSTFGMLLLEGNVDVRTASEMMGHSPAMLAKIYARSRKDLKVSALKKVVELRFG